jgi:hypothetical protein
MFRVRFLEVAGADFAAWDLRGDRKNRHPVPMAIEQAINKMEVARTATAGADRELSGELGLGARRETSYFLMPHMHPLYTFSLAHRVGKAVKRVADYTVNPPYARGGERLDKYLCHLFGHVQILPLSFGLEVLGRQLVAKIL